MYRAVKSVGRDQRTVLFIACDQVQQHDHVAAYIIMLSVSTFGLG